MNSQIIEDLIRRAMPEAEIRVYSDDNVHFEAEVVSPRFAGRRQIDCHREVYDTLGSAMGGDIHALSIKTRTPEGNL